MKTSRPKESQALVDLRDQLIRLQADFENYQKRTEQQKADFIGLANAELINQILPILDNFQRAAAQAPKSDDHNLTNWIIGIQAIENQIEKLLEDNGLTKIKTEPGQPFDPNNHEAISHEQNNLPLDTIIETVETGYKLNDKVLRPAKVRVSSSK